MEWTPERVAGLDLVKLKSLRDNAQKLGNSQVFELCNIELAKRTPKKSASPTLPRASSDYVTGFHFVCDRGQGVTKNSDGTLWTGTWVVDKVHAERAPKIAAYVALHETKTELSYLQGAIKSWRPNKREERYAEGQTTKIEMGVEFLFEPDSQPRAWVGGGSGEKGYARSSVAKVVES